MEWLIIIVVLILFGGNTMMMKDGDCMYMSGKMDKPMQHKM